MTIPTIPTFIIADGVPVRWIKDEAGTIKSEVFDMEHGTFIEDFDYVYNIIQGREGDDARELFKGNREVVSEAAFNSRVETLKKERSERLGDPHG